MLSFLRKTLIAFLVLYTSLGSLPYAKADGLWNEAKNYTASLQDAAKVAAAAVSAAAGVLAAAKQDLANAQAAFAAANAAAATTAATISAMETAAAAVAAAEAALAAATTAAAVAAAIAAAATAGTLIGQGADWLISYCWDPVCDVTSVSVGNGPIYVPATPDEVDALVPQLVFIATGQEMSIDDFYAAGDAGVQSLQFLREEAHMFLGFARGAAAYTAGRDQEVLNASTDLEQELNTLPKTILAFSNILETTSLQSPVEIFQESRVQFDNAMQKAVESLDHNKPDYESTLELLMGASNSFHSAQDKVSSIDYLPLSGPGGAFKNLTLDSYQQFISKCATVGEGCLPPEEIGLVTKLMQASGVYSPTVPDYGVEIAKWDAFFGDNSKEIALFGSSGELSLAEVLSKSVTDLTPDGGPWLGADLEQSPLTISARKSLGVFADGMGGGCSLVTTQHVSNYGWLILVGIFASCLGALGYRRRIRYRKSH